MEKRFKKFSKIFFSVKFLGFCLIGTINTFNSAFFSWLTHLFLQENLAAVCGYIISLTINYALNSMLVFKKRLSFRRYFRFIISYIPNFIIYFLITFLTINTLNLPQFIGTVIAAMAGGPITFIIIKLYAFNSAE